MKLRCLSNGCVPYTQGYLPSQNKNKENEPGVWDYFEETEQCVNFFCSLPGQHANSELGQQIYNMMIDQNGPKLWVEIGAWNGKGTTKRLLQGLHDRKDKADVYIVSYEADPFFYRVAKRNLESNEFYGKQFYLMHGRLPCSSSFIYESEIPNEDKYELSHYHLYFEREKAIYTSAEQIQVPFSPEAAILDGGEYTGCFDWSSLDKSKLKYVFLDDINVFKNRMVCKELLESKEWSVFGEKKDTGNGWIIFKRISYA